jgi:hypothetical protein
MEEITNINTLLQQLSIPETAYVAIYDPDTGAVLSVGPSFAFVDKKNKIDIDTETAELIIEGKIKISSCMIDLIENKLEITEIKSLYKIDDVLHRIVEKQWTEIKKPDIFVTYNQKKNLLTFQLTEEYYGTKKIPKEFHPISKHNVKWSGDTVVNFLITDYNDPNMLYKMISFKVSDLVGKTKTYKDIVLPKQFSIFTRRIFKNYILEIK